MASSGQAQAAIQRWLRQHCESSHLVASGVVIALDAQRDVVHTLAEWPRPGGTASALLSAARAAVQRERTVDIALTLATPESDQNRVVAVPLREGKAVMGAVALGLRQVDGQMAQGMLQALERAAEQLNPLFAQPDPVNDVAAATTALSLQRSFGAQDDMADGAAMLCSELSSALRCERVSMGVVIERDMTVLALSNGIRPEAGQELTRLIGASLQESADQAARIVYPANSTEPLHVVLAHADMHARSALAMATVPLVHQGQVVGALMAERRGDEPWPASALAVMEATAAALAPLVHARQQASRPLRARLRAQWQAAWQRLRRPDDPLPKVLVAAAALGLVGALFVPLPYHISAPARVEGAVQRVVVSPLDGYLHKAHVRPGDEVKAGDLLLELADQDLLLEQRKWESTLAQHENAVSAALARSERAQFVVAQGKAAEARAQLELVRRQLSRTRLEAPIDGIVIKGDLTQSLGAPVQRGDTLVTLAPGRAYRVVIDADERDVAQLSAGLTGQVALSALPLNRLDLELERVTPVATVRDGRNTFEVQARLIQESTHLKPGMQGVAKIDAGTRTLAWQWGHRAMEWLRVSLWAWGW